LPLTAAELATMTFNTLTLEELNRITIEATLGLPPTLTTPEALAAREVLDKETSEIMGKGLMVDLVKE